VVKVKGMRRTVVAAAAFVLSAGGAAGGEDQAGIRNPAATIGLFLATGDAGAAEAIELRRGAELAAQECAGADGQCQLAAAAGTGQWSAGAGELVRLVYSDGIRAVLGPADGRAAHLAEQVVARAKGRFILLSPWASDPALTRIGVPWFFRLAPDDRRQAESLLDEICGARKLRRISAVLAESQFDSRTASDAFERAARARGARELHEVLVREEAPDLAGIVAGVRAAQAEAVLFLGLPATAGRAARRLREAGVTAAFFGSLALASPAFLDAAGDAAEGMVLAAAPEPSGAAAERFRARYRAAHHRDPGAPAAYGYDGALVLIDALRATGGAAGEPLRAALAAVHRDGMTGRIEFDTVGNRAGPAPLAIVERGHLRPVRSADGGAQQQSRLSLSGESVSQ
jgi:branched-chain amino acid transport system substrate-binding protein